MLRNFFEGLGDLFQATFKILPIAGDSVNRLFMAVIAGGLIYWVIQMRKHKAKGEAYTQINVTKKPWLTPGLFCWRCPVAFRALGSI